LAPTGDVSSKKIYPGTNLGTQQTDLFPVEEGAITKFGLVSFVAIKRFPNFLAAETENLHAHESRLLEYCRIAVLDQQETPQDAISIKLKVLEYKEPLFCQASAAQRAIDSQKGGVRGQHGSQPSRCFHTSGSRSGKKIAGLKPSRMVSVIIVIFASPIR
jgi:hypothetical protein